MITFEFADKKWKIPYELAVISDVSPSTGTFINFSTLQFFLSLPTNQYLSWVHLCNVPSTLNPKSKKQAKNRNETGSNLTWDTKLTRVKRLSRKRCSDTTPDRCQEGSRLTILFRIS